ncbi:hypothetical protein HMPREF3200_00542 [Anaerococcus tetradius]|uniref:Uncharacterized protein n=1 Tax=Anaerococcus tetradius TaxID=33036 RepID=A0A133KGV2_9FIRM|nr:hypothetical protein HMPREF3200_00542 [Anaerococcus tetradius]
MTQTYSNKTKQRDLQKASPFKIQKNREKSWLNTISRGERILDFESHLLKAKSCQH